LRNRMIRYAAFAVILMLNACGGGNHAAPAPPAVPTAALSAASTSVNSGASTTLTWTSTNATACQASGGWSGALAANGSQATAAVTASTTFSIVCTGAGGSSSTVSVTVNVKPTGTLTANPTSVPAGGTSTLSWTSSNASACQASGGWTGALAASGSQSTGALSASTVYSLTCSGAGGNSAPVSATVAVAPIPTATLSAAPINVAYGAASTLTWSSTGATSCTGTGGWTSTLAASGSQSTGPLTASTTYSLTCTGIGGTSSVVSAQLLVSPPGVPTVSFSASPPAIASGSSSLLTWSTAGAVTSCTASGAWTGSVATSGSQSTGPLTSNTSYSLYCTGPGGNSPTQTVTVAMAGLLSPKMATIAMTQSAQFSSTLAGGGAVIWSVDGVTNGNSTVGTISTAGLYTAGTTATPVTAGLHIVLAASATDATQAQSAVVAVTDLQGVYTYHNDAARDGANAQEYALNPSNVNTNSFGKLTSCAVDGAIYTQPLWIPQVTIGGARHNVILVATQHDGLFAFDADAVPCLQLWSVSLIDAGHGGTAGETPVPSANVGGAGSSDIAPEVGVTGTPVIDPTTNTATSNTVYVVSKSLDTLGNYWTRLHAIDLLTGNEKSGAPAVVAGTYTGTYAGGSQVTFDTQQELQRAGLGLANGNVYVAFGSHGDNPPWFGWLMTYQYSGTAFPQTAIFNTAPNQSSSGIWMSGGAPSFDSANNAYVVTGNGIFDVTNTSGPTNDYGDSLLELTLTPPTLTVTSYFRPNEASYPLVDISDHDFGSGGATMLADLPAGNAITHALVCGNKDNTLVVLNRDALGGYSPSPVQSISLGEQVFSTAAFWNNNMYIAAAGGPLQAFTLNTTIAQFTQATSSTHVFGFPGATPSVSSAGTQGGVVWSLDTHVYCTTGSPSCGPAVLYAHDAGNLTTELWNSSTIAGDAAGNGVKFSVPTVANGHVYVGTRGNDTGGPVGSATTPGELEIYGLKP